MNRWFQIAIATVSSILTVLSTVTVASGDRATEQVSSHPNNLSSPRLFPLSPNGKTFPSLVQLRQQARSITVKVISAQSWGSGILIHQQGRVYTVLTNQHVLSFAQKKSYQIETPDGQIHQAKQIHAGEFGDRDLGVLQFTSDNHYSVASVSSSAKPTPGETAFAAGFPFEAQTHSLARGFSFTSGTISAIAQKTFAGGYQIGYTNDVRKGMSGGPLLNRRGEVIGINGIHKYPLWGNPYVFQDGSVASKTMQERMSQLSWAIPAQTFLQLAPWFKQ
jgi:S1-C subfamily serine protease